MNEKEKSPLSERLLQFLQSGELEALTAYCCGRAEQAGRALCPLTTWELTAGQRRTIAAIALRKAAAELSRAARAVDGIAFEEISAAWRGGPK